MASNAMALIRLHVASQGQATPEESYIPYVGEGHRRACGDIVHYIRE